MMLSGTQLIAKVQATYPQSKIHAVFPFLRIRIVSVNFSDKDEGEREALLASSLALEISDLRQSCERLFLRMDLFAAEAEDVLRVADHGATWLAEFASQETVTAKTSTSPQVVHFFGYKGGQGRTTLLAFTAHEVARDGLRVLVVDLDAEAPSLDLVLGVGDVQPESTVVGLRAGVDLKPISVAAPSGGGSVSLLAFRPTSEEFDLDATALAFEASIHAPSHERLASRFWETMSTKYDLIMFDHRTGLGATVPAWIRTIPGPIVVFDRLDGQSLRAVRDVKRLWRRLDVPGAIVSYVPATLSADRFRESYRGNAWPWLDALASAMSGAATEELAPEDIDDHWILWSDDNAFRRRALPQRDEVGGATRESVSKLREILGLRARKVIAEPPRSLHPSGASDQGLFIATDALRELSQPGSAIRFVLGRKGTGKTRLLNELVRRSVGEPLVVAEDETTGGLPSQNPDLQALLRRAIGAQVAEGATDTDGFWWTILRAAIKAGGTNTAKLSEQLARSEPLATAVEVRDQARSSPGPARVFFVDGLETMSKRDDARELIQGLLRTVSAIEQDATLRSRLSVRVFLRSDIARWGFENFEQQSHGKSIELSWSTQTIFNFVLSRLPHLDWFAQTFRDTIKKINETAPKIEQGALSVDECLELLLEVFPTKLRRLNLNMSTFLRTYFSDDPSGEVSYYPRVYHSFLEWIEKPRNKLVEGRVSEDDIVRAHDSASEQFLSQVRQELRFLTPLDDGNLQRVLNALKSGNTPFVARELKRSLRNSLKLQKAAIDATLDAMKEIGIFEQHPKLADQWRVGRLFKSALKMKYRRGES